MSSVTTSLVVRRTFRASAERLFAAWTEPSQLQAWWGPAGVTCPHAEVDLRVGGRYRIRNEMQDGDTLWIEGEFEQIERPRLLVYTWRTDKATTPAERVTVQFEPRADKTEVIITHERVTDELTRKQHEAGWIGCLDGLAVHVAD